MFVGHLLVVTVLIVVENVAGMPMSLLENSKVPSSKVLDFLKKYGYVEVGDANSGALYTETGIAETIKVVQKFGALPQTGVLDNATLELMTSPRCGVPDILRHKRRKRYTIGSQGWNKRTISYFIANWSPKLGEQTVAKNIQLALDTWGKYGRLNFRRSMTPDADIIVAFGSSYHGDVYPFDGPGNILAHAFFPNEDGGFGGDIHFDADENWTDLKNEENKNYDGTDFLTVAIHELGHSLGLAHSVVRDSVMFPYYQGYDPDKQLQLGYDDILGMYELYIRRNIIDEVPVQRPTTVRSDVETTETTTTTSPTITTRSYRPESTTENFETTSFVTTKKTTFVTYEGDDEHVHVHKEHDPKHTIPATNSPSLPNICDGQFDAVAVLREDIFIFKEQYVWRLKEMSKILPGYPILIRQMFPDLPKSVMEIDAAYERPDGMIILFTGDKFWVYNGKTFIENSPRSLSDYGLPATIDSIDAVQIWGRNDKTYFYKGDRFWRYNETAQAMDEGYPRHMERWRGVPHNLDAATTLRGVTYFFKDELYWKFDNEWVMITDQSPLPSPQLWVGCPEDYRTLSRL